MGIVVKERDVTKANPIVQFILDGLADSPDHGTESTLPLSYVFDPNDADDKPWLERLAPWETMLASTQDAYATAKAADDKAAMLAADNAIKSITATIRAYRDAAFGRYERTNGKETVIKGSFLDRVVSAINDVNERREFLHGDVITLPKREIDYDDYSVVIVRKAAEMKRTRVLRPKMDSVVSSLDKATAQSLKALQAFLPKAAESETESETETE